MNEPIICTSQDTAALRYAAEILRRHGMTVTDSPNPKVTHLLLPVPCRTDPSELLRNLPPTVTIIGGNLNLPNSIDLLKDDFYLSRNAMITAHAAVTITADNLPVTLEDATVLVLGWGRIGKCLMKLLCAMGSDVTVAVRKPSDRGMIEALGCKSADIHSLRYLLGRFRAILNTVPHPVLDLEQLSHCRPDCIKIELASSPGIAGEAIQARGLPGKYAPESSGKLIAESVLRLLAQREVQG